MEYMRGFADKKFDLAIADPPYGLPSSSTHGRGKLKDRILNKGDIHRWDIRPQQEFFDELLRVSKNVIIWGGNYFALPPSRCVLVWDKCQPWENFSQVEIAWTNMDSPARIFKFDNRKGGKIHPTQKPVELYAWIINNYAKLGGVIFDPMMGSQSSRIAAYKLGCDYIGCEIDDDYFKKGCERFEFECKNIRKESSLIYEQVTLF
jgi:site-specific DNA-methyltransferase (adenine-specific)